MGVPLPQVLAGGGGLPFLPLHVFHRGGGARELPKGGGSVGVWEGVIFFIS